MQKWENDVAVLCIFFARPEQFEKCFEQVRKARPRTLLLWQDGPRKDHPDDMKNILKCREIAENIDWECEVYKNYHEENMGCDPSTHLSHKWAFSIVDKCIILEDDLVVSQSFFTFCKVLLDKYEFDERVDRICGTNLLGQYNIPYDYFFSSTGNSWGWASWKRVADTWDTNYEFLHDEYAISCMENLETDKKPSKQLLDACKLRNDEQIPYWEHIVGARTILYSGLIIYPSQNMVCNIGLSEYSTHAPKNVKMLPKSVRQFFNTKIYEIEFPLSAPKYVVSDKIYPRLCQEKLHDNYIITKIESIYNKLKYGGFKELFATIKRKIRK